MTRCPNCQTENKAGGPLAGYCEKCGSRLPAATAAPATTSAVPPATSTAAPPTLSGNQPTVMTPEQVMELIRSRSAAQPRSIFNRQNVLYAVLGIAAVGFVLFLIFNPNVNIYVDNGGRDTLAVFMDGKQKLVVPPGEVKAFSCYAGSYRFAVKRGETTIFDEAKEVKSRGNAGRGNYLINPEATNRYRTKTIQYGMSFPNIQTYYDEEDRVRKVVGNLDLIPPSTWIDVHPDYVLQPAPKSVEGKFSDSRKVLVRVSKSDATLIDSILQRWERERLERPEPPVDIVARIDWEEMQRQKRSAEGSQVEAAAERIAQAAD